MLDIKCTHILLKMFYHSYQLSLWCDLLFEILFSPTSLTVPKGNDVLLSGNVNAFPAPGLEQQLALNLIMALAHRSSVQKTHRAGWTPEGGPRGLFLNCVALRLCDRETDAFAHMQILMHMACMHTNNVSCAHKCTGRQRNAWNKHTMPRITQPQPQTAFSSLTNWSAVFCCLRSILYISWQIFPLQLSVWDTQLNQWKIVSNCLWIKCQGHAPHIKFV